jgi:hypothetical protein
MKRILVIVILGCVIIILGLGFFVVINKNFLPSEIITEKSDVSAHTVIKEILPIGEYASLAYHYTSVVKDINSRDIKGFTIPFTTRKYIFTYDGKMKLGIDGTRTRVEEAEPVENGKPIIRIILPPIKILSHEIMDESIEVFEQSQTIFNEIKIQDAFKVTAERKQEIEEKVMAGEVVQEARASAEQQLGAFINALPGIPDNYDTVFVWQDLLPDYRQP